MKRNGWLTAIKWLVPMVAIGYCVSLYDKDTLDEKSDLVSTNVESNEKEAIKIDEALETPIHIAFSQPDRICNILVDKGLDPNDPSGAWDVSLFDIEELLAARAILQGGGGLVTSIRNVPEEAIPQICTGVITNALADKHLPLIAMGLTTGIS